MLRMLSVPFSIFFGCVLGGVTVIGIVGNLFVIIAILGDRKMRKSAMNLLLLNLAIADLLYVATFVHAWLPILLYGNGGWILPNVWCAPTRYLSNVFIITSMLTYMAICIERYIAIIHPMKAARFCSRNNILCIVLGIWLFNLVFQAPYLALYIAVPIPGETAISLCHNTQGNHPYWLTFKWVEMVVSFVVPCLVSVVLYTIICRELWSTSSLLNKAQNSIVSHKNGKSKEKNPVTETLAARRSVVKMLITCVVLFYVCYIPMESFFVYGFFWHARLPIPHEGLLVITSMVCGISAFNPFLYTLFSKTFRARVRQIIVSCCGCRKTSHTIRPSQRSITRTTSSFGRI
ncbi:7 transmembrane receptor (rhodopsin family) domain-containing protein [Ditylenchus destructor]|uniref:7 transmembrane receptor (Rhodopsin family) domain-containing protein n=1 Tax=Ditylenchus destructor TaxID=166010 RepID=A0AAD4NFK8_9BILA|nr:7 transmembrane receptor (rhodopsin family) domain-containing protein [Ditylenchus destructor]